MTLRDRYGRLTIWNKIGIWGSVASVIGLPIALISLIPHSTTAAHTPTSSDRPLPELRLERDHGRAAPTVAPSYIAPAQRKEPQEASRFSRGLLLNTPSPTSPPQVFNVTSNNQQGGVTAGIVNVGTVPTAEAPEVDAYLKPLGEAMFRLVIRAKTSVPFECNWVLVTRDNVIVSPIGLEYTRVFPAEDKRIFNTIEEVTRPEKVKDHYIELRFRYRSIYAANFGYPESLAQKQVIRSGALQELQE